LQEYLGEVKSQVGEIYMEMTELKQERLAAKRAASANYRPKEAEVSRHQHVLASYSLEAYLFLTSFPVYFIGQCRRKRNDKKLSMSTSVLVS